MYVCDNPKARALSRKQKAMVTISAVPSEAIRQAVTDLKAVEKMKKYRIDMGTWHDPQLKSEDTWPNSGAGSKTESYCSVCFAGAVIARGIQDDMVDTSPDAFGGKLADRLSAMDAFRLGQIGEGLDLFGKKLPRWIPNEVEVADYKEDPKQFKKDMLELAQFLENNGL